VDAEVKKIENPEKYFKNLYWQIVYPMLLG
jgi:hypothetical protein